MKYDVMDSIRILNQVLRRQQGKMSPDSNGKGHGRLLKLIAENEGLMPKELALMLEVRPPTLSDKLFSLEEDGIIYRKRDEKDKRKTHLYLTPDGRMALERRSNGEKRFQKAVQECLTEKEQVVFCNMCDRLIMAFKGMETEDEIRSKKVVDFYSEQKKRKNKSSEQDFKDGGND